MVGNVALYASSFTAFIKKKMGIRECGEKCFSSFIMNEQSLILFPHFGVLFNAISTYSTIISYGQKKHEWGESSQNDLMNTESNIQKVQKLNIQAY